MYLHRNWPTYSSEKLSEIYSQPWEMNPAWLDHVARREATLLLADQVSHLSAVAADLSCGDAYFASQLPELDWHLGDYAPGYDYEGPIERTIQQIPNVDLFLLCETLEHVEDPSAVLSAIRAKSRRLILTTPLMTCPDENEQHYWAWDDEMVGHMADLAGWRVLDYIQTQPDIGYVFQCWSLF